MSNRTQKNNDEVKFRVVLPVVGKGNLGKSWYDKLFASVMTKYEIPWQGNDLDDANNTFFEAFPNNVTQVKLDAEEAVPQLIKTFRRVNQKAVTVYDVQAHQDKLMVEALKVGQIPEQLKKGQARITALVFPLDDQEVLSSIRDNLIELGGDNVDYVVVINEARIKDREIWDKHVASKLIAEKGGKTIVIPKLFDACRKAITVTETKENRVIAPHEWSNMKVPAEYLGMLEDYLQKVESQIAGAADLLLPDSYAESIKIVDEKKKASSAAGRGVGLDVDDIEL